jgi:spoIIIJ-associated protein
MDLRRKSKMSTEFEIHLLEQGRLWLMTLLNKMGIEAAISAEIRESLTAGLEDQEHDREGWLTIATDSMSPETIQTLIGNRGEVLDSIQYMTSLIVNLQSQEGIKMPFTVDINQYRDRRLAELKQIAEDAVKQARFSRLEQEILSLSSAERRQVHSLLKDFEDIETYSRGKEPDRRLVVKYCESRE